MSLSLMSMNLLNPASYEIYDTLWGRGR